MMLLRGIGGEYWPERILCPMRHFLTGNLAVLLLSSEATVRRFSQEKVF